MKIGIYYDNKLIKDVDCRNPERGNPGIGGTEYCFITLAKLYQIYYPTDQVYQFVTARTKLPTTYEIIEVKNFQDMLEKAEKLKMDIVLVKTPQDKRDYKLIDNLKVKIVCWGHNFYLSDICKYISQNKYIKANVFVGKQMYDRYIDHDICQKSTYIYNCCPNYSKKKRMAFEMDVTYIGSLVPSKGFHVLAKQWKKISKKFPCARLNVIGSGQLYSQCNRLGKYGIADEKYEKKILKYLVDKDGNIINSVRFFGVLGEEKNDIILNTAVGIVNPTGRTETFGLSAIDFEQKGVPVITRKKNGFIDTVLNNKTGILCHTTKSLSNNICRLLKNKSRNINMGIAAANFSSNYLPEKILPQWKKCFEKILKEENFAYIPPNNAYISNAKWLRIINRNIRKILPKVPAIIEIETYVYNFMNIFKRIKRK